MLRIMYFYIYFLGNIIIYNESFIKEIFFCAKFQQTYWKQENRKMVFPPVLNRGKLACLLWKYFSLVK